MTTNTAALLRHLATIIGDIGNGHTYSSGQRCIWSGATTRMDRACVALATELGCGERWEAVAAAVGAHADSLAPGLPEGWTDGGVVDGADGETLYTAYGPSCYYVRLDVRPDGVTTRSNGRAPPAVYAYLLAQAQGVGS